MDARSPAFARTSCTGITFLDTPLLAAGTFFVQKSSAQRQTTEKCVQKKAGNGTVHE